MGYDNSSVTGDEICDYYYDIENNLINPESPSGYFIYKILGGCFDWLNDLIAQFRIDFSILDCDVGSVEIVNSFPEEPDTSHTYYVCTGDGAFKYSFVDGAWVSERFLGDVLNSLDVFWGRSYNLLRPLLYEGIHREYLFIDDGTTASHNDSWDNLSNMSRGTDGTTITNNTGSNLFETVKINNSTLPFTNGDFTVRVEIVENNSSSNRLRINGQNICTGETYAQWDYFLSENETGQFKFTYDSTAHTVQIYKNEKYVRTERHAFCGNMGFLFRLEDGNSIKYKDLKIYKGEDKERPLTDEEYKIYLYLKNHQLLTIKDILTSFTNAFGSAETTTTVLNSIHTVDHKKYDDPSFTNDTLTAYDSDDTDIITDKITDKSGVDVINDRMAQGTLTIQIPDNDWDEEFLTLLEEFISIKGNILISQGG